MPPRPDHSIVEIYIDTTDHVDINHIIETSTGRRYAVLEVREQRRGKHVGRKHLTCIVLAKAEKIGPQSIVHRLVWYKRG